MLPNNVLIGLFRTMLKIRIFEETSAQAWRDCEIQGELHLYCGQEAVATGVCAHLCPEDAVTADHRSHGPLIAKGVDLKRMMAELFGRKTGLCHGKGGHLHLFDTATNCGCSAVIGACLPLALGPALAAKIIGKDLVSVVFFGEGAANQGTFHESLNLASVWNLPVVFVCHDNRYAISTSKSQSTAIEWNADRAAGYGMPGVLVDGMDVVAVYEAAATAVNRAREGDGPSLIEATCYRYRGHFETDPLVYLPEGEIDEWKTKDPIDRLKKQLLEHGFLTTKEVEAIREQVAKEVNQALEFAKASPWPDPDIALLHNFV